jgi:hypothetical protein
MHKSMDRALLKTLIALASMLAASVVCAQDHAVLAATNSPPSAPSAANVSASRLREDAIVAIPIEAAPPAPFVAVPPSPILRGAIVEIPRATTHRFWDRENAILFTSVAASATADFFATHANLANGGRELNPVTRMFTGSTPALAANFALETAGVIGVSYMFHKTGHHRLERLTSFVDATSSVGAVSYDLTHR